MPTLHASDDGAGVPVICLHSGGLSSRQWRRLAAQLAPSHRVIVPDLIGYGASGAWPAGAPFHFERDVEALLALVRGLDQPAHWVGHSYGGLLALHVARAIAVRSLALYEPVTFSVLDPVHDAALRQDLAAIKSTWQPDASGSDEAWFTSFVDWWNGPGAWAAMPHETAAAFRAVGWKLFEEVRTLSADTTGAGFAAVTAPALILGGARTPAVERRTIERLVALLPDARLQIVDGAGHMGPITHHAVVNAAIFEHVRAH
ncbi:MAG TPA: alpha/beta fold hydrolase [Kofleriaceae bacterium]|nr:alpha/beta fold hydrolase [Kofleriaceae bacterium]